MHRILVSSRLSPLNRRVIIPYMTKLLEQAIARLRTLPENVQDSAARALISQLDEEPEPGDSDAIKMGREEFAAGKFTTLDDWRNEVRLGDR